MRWRHSQQIRHYGGPLEAHLTWDATQLFRRTHERPRQILAERASDPSADVCAAQFSALPDHLRAAQMSRAGAVRVRILQHGLSDPLASNPRLLRQICLQ